MSTLYERDLHAWSTEQAQKIREGAFGSIDRENIAEELESLGRSEQARLARHFELYLVHRLRWEYQPERRTRSWMLTMNEQHRQAIKVVEKSPSLKGVARELFADAWISGRVLALTQTGIDEADIPEEISLAFEDCFPELAVR
jgi:hypothetical protein